MTKRDWAVKTLASVVILVAATGAAAAQSKKPVARTASQPATYAPRIIAVSNSSIIEATVVAVGLESLTVKTAKGLTLRFDLDDQTSILESGELVSIATLPDLTLDASSLRPFDKIEIVFEREGSKKLARIITRTLPANRQLAKR